MYAAVLMIAVTSGGESIDFGRRGCNSAAYSCSANYGCCGGYSRRGCCTGYSSCSGYHGPYSYYGGNSCCSGYYRPYSYYGCSSYSSGPVYSAGTLPTTNQPLRVAARAPATIIVNVPAEARLTFDGAATRATGTRRAFATPGLDPGATFVYTVRAELVVDGKSTIQTQNVIVRAGETSTVQFEAPQGVAER